MALFGSIETLRAHAPQTPGFTAAFRYVDELLRVGTPAHDRISRLGRGESQKIELAAGAFAIDQVYETKPRAEGFFESHRKYIDLQVVVAGDEIMEVIDASRISVHEPYNPERDLIKYADAAGASLLHVLPGEATIFYPVDVHMPSLQRKGAPTLVRKTVVKIPVA